MNARSRKGNFPKPCFVIGRWRGWTYQTLRETTQTCLPEDVLNMVADLVVAQAKLKGGVNRCGQYVLDRHQAGENGTGS